MSATAHTPDYPPLEERPIKNTICLFDVDGTLTGACKVGHHQLCILLSSG